MKKRKTYFKIHTRWGSRARLNALLTIAACRDVVGRVKSHVHSVVIDLVFFDFFQYISLFSLFFVFLIFWVVFYIVSLCFRCLCLFLYLLQILFLLCFWFLSFFHLFCWLGSFVHFLFLNVLVSFFCFSFFFSLCVCVVLFFRCLWLFQTKLQISCLCVRFLFKNINLFLSSFLFECPFSNTKFPFFALVCNFVCWISSPCFFLFGEKWGKGSKNTRPEICCFSLSLFFKQFSFFTFFTIWFCCFFLPFLMFFHHKNKKYRNRVFICVSHQFYLNQFTNKCFLTFSLKFLSCRCLFFTLCFCIFNFLKEKFSLPLLRPFFVFLLFSCDFYLLFSYLTSFLFSSPFFLFPSFSLYSLCFSFSFFSFLLVIFLSSFLPILWTFTSPVLCFRLFEHQKNICLDTSPLFSIPVMIFFSKKESPFSKNIFVSDSKHKKKLNKKERRYRRDQKCFGNMNQERV